MCGWTVLLLPEEPEDVGGKKDGREGRRRDRLIMRVPSGMP